MKNRLVPFSWKQDFKTAVILVPPAPKLLFFSLIILVLFIFPYGLCSQGLSLLLVFPSSWFVSFWNTLQLKYTAKTEDNSSSSWSEMERSIHGFTSNSLFQFLLFCRTYQVCDAYVECRSFPSLLVCHCFLFSVQLNNSAEENYLSIVPLEFCPVIFLISFAVCQDHFEFQILPPVCLKFLSDFILSAKKNYKHP